MTYPIFITRICPECGQNTLVQSTYADVCHNCDYGQIYPSTIYSSDKED